MRLLWILLLLPFGMNAQFNVMTYNIRLGSVDDGPNHWDIRKEKLRDLMDYYDCGIYGLQEAQLPQIKYLLEGLKGYGVSGKPRTLDANAEYSCILYDTTRFRVSEEKTLWLSTRPDTISLGWDARIPRVASYALFEDKEKKDRFWLINTHFDHQGLVARFESAKLLVKLTKELNQKLPVILMGDFNARPTENTIQVLKEVFFDTREYSLTKAYSGPDTWNGFQFDSLPYGQIDYIFIYDPASKMRVYKHATLMDHYDHKYPSDHFPVMIQTGFFVANPKKSGYW